MQGSKIRVLIIPRPEPADAVTSGIGRYVGVLESHLGPDIEVVHLPGAPHQEDRQFFREEGPARGWRRFLRALVPESIRLILAYVRDIRQLARQLRPYRDQVDIIHVNRVGCEIQTIAAKWAGFRRILATIHNAPGEDETAGHLVRRLVERISFACADHLIAVSKDTMGRWASRVGVKSSKVSVIHNGIDISPLDMPRRQVAREKYGLSDDTVAFGICARLHRMKGHHVLVEAFAEVVHQCPNCCLLIAGEGPEEESIHFLIEKYGLQQKVRMVGYQKGPLEFFAALDVNLLPSVTLESIGYSIIEGMHLGIPAVVSDIGGGQEITRASGGGVVVPRGNSGALAAAMSRYVVNIAERREAGERAAEYARAYLTGARMAQATEELYRALRDA